MKTKHSTVKVVLAVLLLFMLLTWILPAAYFQSSYVEQGRVQMGIFDLFSYPVTALSYFGYVALFILVVGGFYGVLNKIDAYRTLLDSLATKFKKKGKLAVSIIMVLIAIITSVCGLQMGLMIFYPAIIALVLLMGYDRIVAALTVVGSSLIGVAGTTFGYGNINNIMTNLGLDITSNIVVRIVILVLGLALLIFNTIRYINKIELEEKKAAKEAKKAEKKSTKEEKTTKKTTAKSKTTKKSAKETVAEVKKEVVKVVETKINEEEDLIPKKGRGKHKTLPLIIVLSLMFIILILSFISWSGAFGVTAFDKATESVTSKEIFGFALFGKLLGNVNAFGSWNLTELITLMIVFSGILMIIYKVKFNEGLDAFAQGAKRALEPALLVVLIYTGLVIVTYHPFQLVIYKFLFGFTKGFNVITSTLAAMLSSLFNADPLYVFQSVLPYFASIVSKKSTLAIAGVVYQSVYGLTMLVAPTSIVLMTVLSYLGVSYKQWLKNIWKLALELLVLLLIIFTILVLI